MKIVHVASEFAPIAKAGGLGEVLLGLGREQSKSGNFVDIIIPKYDFIDAEKLQNLKIEVADFKCQGCTNHMWSAQVEGCHLHLLEACHPAGFFHRGRMYGCDDDIARFAYFSKAVLEYLNVKGQSIDVLHLHDWHVSLCAPMVRDYFKDLSIQSIVLTIHNLAYQGKCAAHDLDALGLRGGEYLVKEKLQDDDPNYPHSINLLKGGIVYSDAVVAVSPSYSKEMLNPEFGFGLENTLKRVKGKVKGILNGIDMKTWDPSQDLHLKKQYFPESASRAKEINQQKMGFDAKKRPLVGAITRLVQQKGLDLIEEAIKTTVDQGGCFVLLGSASDPQIQAHFNQLQKTYEKTSRVVFNFCYEESLAHLIYGSLDFLVVPSRYEPCGLTQMIAMRYGVVPIVRLTGGLKDTVFDYDDYRVPAEKRNGFTFKEYSAKSLNETLLRAFELFRRNPAGYQSLVRRGMTSDFSWKKSSQKYLRLYQTLLKKKNALSLESFFDVRPVRVDVIDDGNSCVKG